MIKLSEIDFSKSGSYFAWIRTQKEKFYSFNIKGRAANRRERHVGQSPKCCPEPNHTGAWLLTSPYC